MSFVAKIAGIYQGHGPKHLLPFIGQSYEEDSPDAFRVAVVGLNAYILEPDVLAAPDPHSYAGWWRQAGHGKSYRFFTTAHREAGLLAEDLAGQSKLFSGLMHGDAFVHQPGPTRRFKSGSRRSRAAHAVPAIPALDCELRDLDEQSWSENSRCSPKVGS